MSTINNVDINFSNAKIDKSTLNITGVEIIQSGESLSEFDEAIRRIKAIPESELQQAQKEFLIGIMSDARKAVEKGDDVAQKGCTDRFTAFKVGAGKVADKVISVLANLATIAMLFGFGAK